MIRSRRLPVLLAALALGATPVTALGQSAGDDQYEDPFADEAPQEQPAPASAPEPEPEPAPSGAVARADDDGTAAPVPAPAVAAPAAGDQLPRTGADAGTLAAAGVVLLAGGVALRRRVGSA